MILTGNMLFLALTFTKKLKMLDKIILNIIRNYHSSKTIICNVKDPQLWLTDAIKTLI